MNNVKIENIEISVVIPVYKNEPFIEPSYSRLNALLSVINENFEIIFVNDGSPDASWVHIAKCASRDKRVRGIRFSRNFGQHIAITAKNMLLALSLYLVFSRETAKKGFLYVVFGAVP